MGRTRNFGLNGTGLRRRKRSSCCKRRRRGMRGGILPALIPIIAAAIGAVPGIASVAVQAAQANRG